jgi:hypothetical protein
LGSERIAEFSGVGNDADLEALLAGALEIFEGIDESDLPGSHDHDVVAGLDDIVQDVR